MPRWLSLILALALLAAFASVPNWRGIGDLLAAHWVGLIPVSLARFIPIAAAATGWWVLFLGPVRRNWPFCFYLMWLRESVNGLLPVAKVGGEISSIILLRRYGLSVSAAVAATLIETFVSVIGLALFVMIGLGWLSVAYGGIAPVWIITGGLSLIGLFTFLILLAPRLGLLRRLMDNVRHWLPSANKAGGKSEGRLDWPRQAVAIERWLLWYAHRFRMLFVCWLFQFTSWSLGAGELYLAALVLHIRLNLLNCVMLEAAVQAAVNAGFFLPAGLGAQEAAFIGAGALVGLSPEAAAALALARRGRDILIYTPALLRWSSRTAAQTS